MFEVTNELKGLQARMSNLFMRQKSRGGIIDLDAEENNVISIDSEDEVCINSTSFFFFEFLQQMFPFPGK